MENNDLKNLWAQLDKQEVRKEEKLDVDGILRSKSQSVVDKITRNVKIDGTIVLITIPLVALLAFYREDLFWFIFVGELICIYELVLFWFLFKRLKATACGDSLKMYFKGVLYVLQGFFRHYLILGLIVVPVIYSWGVTSLTNIDISTSVGIIVFSSGFILGIGAIYYVLSLMYGKKISSLRKLIEDMDQE